MKVLVTAALAAFALTPLRAEDDQKKALEALRGEWKVVECVRDGEAVEPENLKEAKCVFSGSKMSFSAADGERPHELTITLDPKAVPAAVDIKVMRGDREVVLRGIYKLDKDRLTICYGGTRPKEFKSVRNSDIRLFVFERAKK